MLENSEPIKTISLITLYRSTCPVLRWPSVAARVYTHLEVFKISSEEESISASLNLQ